MSRAEPKKRVYLRLLLPYLLIVAFFLASSGWIFATQRQHLQKGTEDALFRQANHLKETWELEINRLSTIATLFLTDDKVNRLALFSDYLTEIERMDLILNVQYRLESLLHSSDLIRDVAVMIPSIDRSINTTTTFPFEIERFEALLENYSHPFTILGDTAYICFFNPLVSIRKEAPFFLLYIELSLQNMSRALEMTMDIEAGGGLYQIGDLTIPVGADASVLALIRDENGVTALDAKAGYLVSHVISRGYGFQLALYCTEESAFAAIYQFNALQIALFALMAVLSFAYSLYLYTNSHKPLQKLLWAFHEIEQEHFDIEIAHKIDDEYGYIYRSFHQMAKKLSTLINEVYKQQLLLQTARLKHLQAQINPHFLYNSFFLLNTMAQLNDQEFVTTFTQQLGEYFRYVTRDAKEEVTLMQELAHAQTYAQIQKKRFQNRLTLHFSPAPEITQTIKTPRLILQPLIENAFQHGLERREEACTLAVCVSVERDAVYVSVDDSGAEVDDALLERLQDMLALPLAAQEETTGLVNIHCRLRLHYGMGGGLTVERSDLGGLRAVVRIPIGEGSGDV